MNVNQSNFDQLWQTVTANHRHAKLAQSTNSELMDALTQGQIAHQTLHLYTADQQSAGRGQHGRSWISPQGNVFLSLYVPMRTQAHDFGIDQLSGLISLLVGFYLVKMPIIEQINQIRMTKNLPTIGVKWANDLGFIDQAHPKFHKLAGILIEPVFKAINHHSTLIGLVIGVGLNVKNSPMIQNSLYESTSLSDLWQADELPDAATLYQPICEAICQAVAHHNQLTLAHHQALTEFVHEFNQVHVLTGRDVQVFLQDDREKITHAGRCIGINDQGALVLQTQQGEHSLFAGMVQLKS
ncbi:MULTISPECIES: biotin--[acetyl-CoA-carboxylase] ligase [Moraxella]|uniref:Biotin-protein ligase n=1 Tax=Moraxella catarrhalis TaxID=480 RepID=A0A198UXE3_MORCA|nr:biotin--[acetyl-CoA-carboxylase] ligase [Moraxella catarrhalis]OAU95829.1 Biotin-protein ligase [Moraxella catarrhalis]OAU97887.1 Biotin-protein ligase [Moraxella catarrhalis]OAV01011.1 Biotin-protein ligase [Moraxella catarrhalis]OAV04042.1 Biotin-protein ligase [Moraxella catarrhalis]STY81146.1 Bifunctional protein BirA [Moraxella catarrhalis]